MATNAKKSHGQLFDLLRRAHRDTYWQIRDFLTQKICDPTENPLKEISDKTLTRHLDALLNGVNEQLWSHSSTRQRRASGKSPLKRELNPFGIGDASKSGQWHDAVNALQRYIEATATPGPRLRVGQALCFFAQRRFDGLSDNLMITLLTPWLLGGELSNELVERFSKSLASHFKLRINDVDWPERQQVLEETWFTTDGQNIAYELDRCRPLPKHDAVYREVLECAMYLAADDAVKAEELTKRLFPNFQPA